MAFFQSNQALSIVCTNRKLEKESKMAPEDKMVPKNEIFYPVGRFVLIHKFKRILTHPKIYAVNIQHDKLSSNHFALH